MSDERKEILDLLDDTGPLRAAEIAKRLGKADNTVRTLLQRLRDTKYVVQGSDKLWNGRSGVVDVVVSGEKHYTHYGTTDVTHTTALQEREKNRGAG